MRPTAVLVHGAHHGGWCWKRVAEPLRQKGWTVYAPSLTGAGDRAHLLSSEVTLATRVQDIVSLFESEELQNVILCGHSAGGIVVTGVAERIPERIAHLVCLDAVVPEDGQSIFDLLTDDQGLVTATRSVAAQLGDGWRLPVHLMSAESFGLTDPEDVAWVNRRMTDETIRHLEDSLSVGPGLGKVAAKTYVRTERFSVPFRDRLFERLSGDAEWEVQSWDVGHDVMIEAPERVVRLLEDAAARVGVG